ncbi:hypothetical protein SAMN06272727_6412 [Streptomyces sp. Ag82_G6-1]|nr:hypothetical protein SAMN06272727_6412 [Streptomyces sp. Ag82_G6-1]
MTTTAKIGTETAALRASACSAPHIRDGTVHVARGVVRHNHLGASPLRGGGTAPSNTRRPGHRYRHGHPPGAAVCHGGLQRAVLQELAPDELQGRAQATGAWLAFSLRPFAALAAGGLGTWLGLHLTLMLITAAMVIPFLVLWNSPVRRLRGPNGSPPPLRSRQGTDTTRRAGETQRSATKQEATDSRPLLCHVAAQQRTGRPELSGFSPRSKSTRCGYAARVNCHQLTLNKKPLPPLNVR